ncbi:PQ loop repeat-domain-containing protein [Lentinula aciculospora]|uniref:PQ loop repeat-domain-containing protein n=1 Tax=Lentinula aciculospora TaxID=153920 RepID=A0A9W9DHX9_9AGAR|nr:PQ loop repeat-domain-containing protein [Lentinula aciculospora]
MPVNSVAENVFGTSGTICWTVQLVPQLWKTYREKDSTGLSDWMILAWSISGVFLGTYSIVKNLNIPLIVQPQLFSLLTMASWAQCQYYGRRRSFNMTLLLFLCGCAILGGFEVGTVYAVQPSFSRGKRSGTEGIEFFGAMSTIFITIAFIPQYYEIYKHKEVIGISTLFMAVDLLGVFSDLSLVFKSGNFDIVAAVTYSLVIVLDGSVILAAWILNPHARRRRQHLDELEVSGLRIERPTTGVHQGTDGVVSTDTASATPVSQCPLTTATATPQSSCLLEKV